MIKRSPNLLFVGPLCNLAEYGNIFYVQAENRPSKRWLDVSLSLSLIIVICMIYRILDTCNLHPLICYIVCVSGSYFCYDNPAALQDRMEQDLKLTTSQFMWFYSMYSWPNVILCFFGGFLIDRVFGVRLGAIIFSVFVVAGQVLHNN